MNKYIILCGKSASGKNTIFDHLKNNNIAIPIIPLTTRPIRDGEVDGIDYKFITKAQFIDMVNSDMFIEHRSYNTLVNNVSDTWYYGTPKVLDNNDTYVAILDPKGARGMLRKCGVENCNTYYLNVNDHIRKVRCITRKDFDETEWNRRLEDDKVQFSKVNLLLINAKELSSKTYKTSEMIEQLLNDLKGA